MLLVGTILGGWGAPLLAQDFSARARPLPTAPATHAASPAPAPTAPAAASGVIRSVAVKGAERLEPETIRSLRQS